MKSEEEEEEEEERSGVTEDRMSLSQVDTSQVTRRSDGVALWAQLLVSLREREGERERERGRGRESRSGERWIKHPAV